MLQQSDPIINWDYLQERRFTSTVSNSYLRLLAALDSGWEIKSVGLVPATQPGEPKEFCFILARQEGKESRNLQLPQCKELAQYIAVERLSVWNEAHFGLM